MTNKTELCGFQPSGKNEDIPKPPKFNLNSDFWRSQWVQASGDHLVEFLRAEKLQEQLNTAKKALTEIAEFDCSDDCYFTARDALEAIGGDDD